MQIKQSTISWGLIFAATFFFIWLVGGILAPFIFGIIIAYFLDPVADELEERGLSRGTATLIVLSSFLSVLVAVILLFGPIFLDQIGSLISKIPTYVSALEEHYGATVRTFLGNVQQPAIQTQAKDIAMKFSGELLALSGALLTGIFTSGAAIFSILSLVLISPIIAFYMLRDWDILVKKIDELLPRSKVSAIRKNFVKIDEIISAYIRGQVSVCILMGIFYAVNLTLVGLNYGFAIGFMTGILSFIPYIGMMIGASTGLIVAYVQFGLTDGMLLVLAVFIFGNVIEGNIVTPKLVGDKVELHPAWIIFALLAAGAIFGFTGILIAIPAAAVIGVLTRSSVEAYRESELYLGYDSRSLQLGGKYEQESFVTEREETPVFSGFENLKPQKRPDKMKIANNPKTKKKKKKKEPELRFPK